MAEFYTYQASGSLSIKKCGKGYSVDYTFIRNTVFQVGDQAWLRYKAEKGILEKIVVKKIKIFRWDYKGEGPSVVVYTDTFNAIYNEWDLISYSDAATLSEIYLTKLNAAKEAAKCLT